MALALFASFAAVKRGDIAETSKLLEAGVCPHQADKQGVSALIYSVARGHLECARLLVLHGAEVSWADPTGATALDAACSQGQAGCAELLLKSGAKVNLTNSHGHGAVFQACRLYIRATAGSVECLLLLLNHGADPADLLRPDADGTTPLMVASHGGHLALVRHLLERGAPPDQTDGNGYTPLMVAACVDMYPVPQPCCTYAGCARTVRTCGAGQLAPRSVPYAVPYAYQSRA
eukprot:scaffold18942_cov63-Phaeocystis_antarctica.AAC.4